VRNHERDEITGQFAAQVPPIESFAAAERQTEASFVLRCYLEKLPAGVDAEPHLDPTARPLTQDLEHAPRAAQVPPTRHRGDSRDTSPFSAAAAEVDGRHRSRWVPFIRTGKDPSPRPPRRRRDSQSPCVVGLCLKVWLPRSSAHCKYGRSVATNEMTAKLSGSAPAGAERLRRICEGVAL